MLSARKALFLRRRQDLAVLDQRRSAVVIKRGNTEHSHAGSEQCVDERRECAALSDHQQCAHDREHYDHRQEPEFLARTHKTPEFGYKIHIEVFRTDPSSTRAEDLGACEVSSKRPAPVPTSIAKRPCAVDAL